MVHFDSSATRMMLNPFYRILLTTGATFLQVVSDGISASDYFLLWTLAYHPCMFDQVNK